jgi:hypothetical protein
MAHPLSLDLDQHLLLASVAVRICQLGTHRLSNVRPGQILQTASGHVLTSHPLPETVSTI